MKTTQVVSGLLLGSSLLITPQIARAYVLLDDGGVHVVNDLSLLNEWIELRNGSTLRLEAGGAVGGDFDHAGTVVAFDTSTVVLAGGRLGGGGGASGAVLLYDGSHFVTEGGLLGGGGFASGQVTAFNAATVTVIDGTLGGSGIMSGMVGFYDGSRGIIRGGQFHDNGMYSGLVIAYGDSTAEVFLSNASLPYGVLADYSASISGNWSDGSSAQLTVMREPTAQVILVEETTEEDVLDSDGDGVSDDVDACLNSDLRPTIWIRDIDTGLPNLIDGQVVSADGCSLADLVAAVVDAAAANARNHGQFVQSVARGLKAMINAGLLPTNKLGVLQNCVARCSWSE